MSTSFSLGSSRDGAPVSPLVRAGVGVGAGVAVGVSAAGGGVSLRLGEKGVGVGAGIGAGLDRASGSAGAEVRSSWATGAGSEDGRLRKTLAIPTKPATISAIATTPKIDHTLRFPDPEDTTAGAVLEPPGD